jgi:hypothetical protein
MLFDSISLTEGANFTNLTVASGTSFPSNPSAGELFYRTDLAALHVHSGTAWVAVGTGSGGSSAAADLTGTTIASNVIYSSLTSVGTITSGTWSGSFGSVSGSNLTTLNASNLASGTVGTARLGTGTASSSTFLRGDGTWAAPTASDTSYDIALMCGGKPTQGARVLYVPVIRNCSLPLNATGSRASAATVGTVSSASFTINKNGSSIGTINFAVSSSTATFSVTATNFSVGDILEIVAPNPQNATLAEIGISLSLTLS